MGTLLLRLVGPMQSWGTQSRFRIRDAGTEPSKSGVIGLLCAALGRSRDQNVDDLAALRMGVRVDREGTLRLDYHTAGGSHRKGETYGVYRASGGAGDPVVSERYYLADAEFLVGLEGDDSLLTLLHAAVRQPKWQIFLGRKSFVPGLPVCLRNPLCLDRDLGSALKGEPWPLEGTPLPDTRRWPRRLRVILEASGGEEVEARQDQPVGAAFRDRRFVARGVKIEWWELGKDVPIRKE